MPPARRAAAAVLPAGLAGRGFRRAGSCRLELDLATWRAEIARTDAIVAIRSLDDTIPSERRGTLSLRWVLWHVFEEYARHNGHADIIREAIDGSVGE